MQRGTKNVAVVMGGEPDMIKAGFAWYQGGEVIIQESGKRIKLKLK